jgi:hypothetical protein
MPDMETAAVAAAESGNVLAKQNNKPESKPRTAVWQRDGDAWVLTAGRRRMGRVVPDSKHPGMFRSVMSGGWLSGMANLLWAKDAVLAAAERELEWEARRQAATAPLKRPVNEGVFSATASPVRSNDAPGTRPLNTL